MKLRMSPDEEIQCKILASIKFERDRQDKEESPEFMRTVINGHSAGLTFQDLVYEAAILVACLEKMEKEKMKVLQFPETKKVTPDGPNPINVS